MSSLPRPSRYSYGEATGVKGGGEDEEQEAAANSQPDVDLGDVGAEPVGAALGGGGKVGLGTVEGVEDGDDAALVGGLRGGEAALVDAVVDPVVLPLVRLVDLLAPCLGVQLDAAVLFLDEVVELPAHGRG